jgi:hypothetical protein
MVIDPVPQAPGVAVRDVGMQAYATKTGNTREMMMEMDRKYFDLTTLGILSSKEEVVSDGIVYIVAHIGDPFLGPVDRGMPTVPRAILLLLCELRSLPLH